VRSWFTDDGALGAVEERRDRYQIGHPIDVGVKLRAGSVLEVKLRRSITSIDPVASGTDGPPALARGAVEVWRKWRPAEDMLDIGSKPWVEIRKTIVKRRFTIDGEERAVLDLAQSPVGAFCDVEIVAIGDGSTSAWSFAFAAYGPVRSRHLGIETAWRTLLSVTAPVPRSLVFGVSCGYPEWLQRRHVVRRDLAQAVAEALVPDPRTDRERSVP
jgi:hypothetical protein